jgi:uncharacterized protein (DUF433 family)
MDIVVSDPEILGGKPVIKGTRMPVSLVFELAGMNYSIDQIIDYYPFLDKEIVLEILRMGQEIKESLTHVDFATYLEKEPVQD